MPDGFSVDSYKLPVQPSPVDIAVKYGQAAQQAALMPGQLQQQQQQIQSGALSISKQKLDLINQNFGMLNKEISVLANDPNVTKPQIIQRLNSFADMTNMPTVVRQKMLNEAASVPPGQEHDYLDHVMRRNMSTQEQLNNQYGLPLMLANGQQTTPSAVSQQKQTVTPIGAPIQQQPPPTSETVDNNITLPNGQPNPNYGGKRMLGPQDPQLPAGALPVAGGLPGQFRAPPPTMAPAGPVRGPSIAGPSSNFGPPGTKVVSAEAEPPTFKDRFNSAFRPTGPTTALPPGAGEAVKIGAEAGANAAAVGRDRAARYNRDIFPLNQAIPALERLGKTGTGPGTETINNIKSFLQSAGVPGINANNIKDMDEAKKYLTDYVNQTGNSGTNDKLAAAFAGNPSVGISNAAAVDVAKSALALRRMQQTEDLAFEKSGLPDRDRQKFSVQFNSSQDPRAYGIDMMSKEKLQKLLKGMTKKEREVFNNSVVAAHQGVIK